MVQNLEKIKRINMFLYIYYNMYKTFFTTPIMVDSSGKFSDNQGCFGLNIRPALHPIERKQVRVLNPAFLPAYLV